MPQIEFIVEPAIKEGNDHIFATFAQGLIVVYAMERSNPMLWSKRLDEDVTSITWCPFYKAIAICSSSTVQIFQAEDGLILNTIQRSICNDLLWKRLNGPFKSMLILNCHDGLFFFADGMHPVFNIPSPFDLLDVNISDDLSQIQCIHRDNSVSNYSTNWDFSLMKSFTRISDQIVESSTICTSWNNLVAALAKYITGLNWLRTKLSQTDADVNNAVLGLSLLTADDNIYLQRLKDSVTIRDAYRFRDQLVRCFEDVKSRAEQVNDSCLTIPEESNSCLLAWFLAREEIEDVPVSKIIKALDLSTWHDLQKLAQDRVLQEDNRKCRLEKQLDDLRQDPVLTGTSKTASQNV